MSHLLNAARRLVAREEGATMVEYGLMVALIAVVCVGAVTLIGGNLSGMFTTMAGNFESPLVTAASLLSFTPVALFWSFSHGPIAQRCSSPGCP
jgi:pilus assembly protein Flp/PilA